MMRRIVTSVGRTAFRSRNFTALRMAARDEPAGFGANTGLNSKTGAGASEGWSAKSKDQVHDFKKDAKLEQKGQSNAYQAETHKAANEGMTQNKNDSRNNRNDTNRSANTSDVLGKNTANNSQQDSAKPWEAKGKDTTQTKVDSMHKPAGQQGPGAFKSGSHTTDNMRTSGSTNQWEANHVHNDKCGHNVVGQDSVTSAKTCKNDSAACRMDSGKCSTHNSQKTSQWEADHVHNDKCGHDQNSAYSANTCQNDSSACRMDSGKCSTHSGQKVDQGMMDKAMNWVKEKFGGSTTTGSNQQNTKDIKEKNRATADSDKAFNDKKEYKSDQKQNRH